MATNIAWTPQPRQEIALGCSEREVLFGGARFGGKSETGRAWLCELPYISNPRYQGLVIRKNATDLAEWLEKTRNFIKPTGAVISGTPTTIKFPAGGIIWTGHLKDENAYEKYQGWELQKILVEELTQIPRESDYEKLISSCRSTVPGLAAQVLSTANPGGPGHVWVKARFHINKPYIPFKPFLVNPDDPLEQQFHRVFIQAKAANNPIGCKADPQYVSQLMSIKDPKLRAAWIDGDWDVFSGQFFDMWSDQVHVIKPFVIPQDWMRYRGLDWGYAAFAACPWIATDYSGNHYIYREYYKDRETPRNTARNILQMSTGEQINLTLADPSIWAKNQYGSGEYDEQATSKSIAQVFDEEGLFCTKANNDRTSGWNVVRDMLYWDINHRPKLFVFDTCPNIIRTMPGLVHDDNKVEDLESDGSEDHLADAIRYTLMHTYKSIQSEGKKTEIEQFIESIEQDTAEKFNWSSTV